ncbi:hypothetical protein LSTR_LSTR013656 [Laodelphax striatellus]|uniref:Odorant receptor n=1 Tax=Laodelphax striatellus TaxID=195883 RepID=A0A482WZZ9_LAOST|nr:hypothetical protein LSTR_LSTR013656 [Laodelphax striatellus]
MIPVGFGIRLEQIKTEAPKKMRQVLIQRGHYEGERISALTQFYVILTVIFILNTILDIYNLEANQLEEKIFRFKNINMLICALAYPLLDKSTYRLITYIENQGHTGLAFKSTPARKTLQHQLNAELYHVNKLTSTIVVSTLGTLSVAPLLAAIFKIYVQKSVGSQIDVSRFALPISFWYPEQFKTTFVYFSLYVLQVIYIYLFAGYMYCGLTSGIMALKITIYYLKLLCLTVEEWDGNDMENNYDANYENFDDGENSTGSKNMRKFENNIVEHDLSLLKTDIVNVIKFHDIICSRASGMNKDFEMMYTILNNTICFQMCVCLYSSAKMNDLVLKIENFLIIMPLAGMLFLYCFYAQQLLNEGEKFRTTLWESNFIDKPKWFKSSMLIIMIRIAKELEIKPFGFYVLNLRTFSMVL